MIKLNEKLAEWAGFTVVQSVSMGGEASVAQYLLPDGKHHCWGCPNFTESLDACFKWLVPKLGKVWLAYGLNDDTSSPLYKAFACNNLTCFTIFAETPALALCRAVEKLIDGGKDD